MTPGGQTRVGSVAETIVNTAVGFASAFVTQLIIMPWYGLSITARESLSMGLIFTAVSIVRGYLMRRAFNWWLVR